MTLDRTPRWKTVAAAIFDPGATEGFKGDRTLTEWQADAVERALSSLPHAGKVSEETGQAAIDRLRLHLHDAATFVLSSDDLENVVAEFDALRAALSSQQAEAVPVGYVACIACEGSPNAPNDPCGLCGTSSSPSPADAGEPGIEAERERCANVAREFSTIRQVMSEVEYAVNDRFGGDATVDEFVPIICERIAAAIQASASPATSQAKGAPSNWLATAQRGYDEWAAKPHNAKWVRKIDGTPIPNDLTVCIGQAFANDLRTSSPVGQDTAQGGGE